MSSNSNPITSLLQSMLPVNTEQSGSQQTSTSGASSSERVLLPGQEQIENPVFSLVGNLLSDPEAYVAPFETQALNQVNDSYSGVQQSLAQQFLSTGGGTSGKYGLALANANNSRLSSLADTESTFQQTASQLPLTAAGLADNLLGLNFGQESSSDGSTDTTSQASSQKTTGTPASDGLSVLLAGLSKLL